ncbi:hypothetical protein F5Y02DRAFT_404711 [Annulohypoxylon stygium]|nr:hypothetical protein F5Y02DRAFT_404711 [Annulohypoxylon stygium]
MSDESTGEINGGLSSKLRTMNTDDLPGEKMRFCPWKAIRTFPYVHGNGQNREVVSRYLEQKSERCHYSLHLRWGKSLTRFYSRTVPQNSYFLSDPNGFGRDPLLLVPTSQFKDFVDVVGAQLQISLPIPRGLTGEKFSLAFGSWGMPLPRFLGRAQSLDDLERFKDQAKRSPQDYSRGLDIDVSSTSWDADKLVPFQTKDTVRFVCVDVEAWERSRHVITEVGFAVLDTEDTMRVAPGKDGGNWFELIKSRHFVIREHVDKINTIYVQGCPHLFSFGASEYVYSKDIARMIGNIIGDTESEDKRPVIMVGHDMVQDLKYLTDVGFNIWRVPQFKDEIDTKSMYQRLQKSANGRALSTLCEELGVPGYNFHNAGNDATYTLRAMIAMAVQQATKGSSNIEPG